MSRYRELLRKIEELEKRAGSNEPRFKWIDRDGVMHLSSFKVFSALKGQYSVSMEDGPLSQEDCPIREVNAAQIASLPKAQQMFLSNMLTWLGFPIMELVTLEDGRQIWRLKTGIVAVK